MHLIEFVLIEYLFFCLGPLLYHFADMPGQDSIEFSYAELKKAIQLKGFEFVVRQWSLACSSIWLYCFTSRFFFTERRTQHPLNIHPRPQLHAAVSLQVRSHGPPKTGYREPGLMPPPRSTIVNIFINKAFSYKMSREGFVLGVDNPIIIERDCGGWSIGNKLYLTFLCGELIVKGWFDNGPMV